MSSLQPFQGSERTDVSWKVVCGANVAYDQFPSQNQVRLTSRTMKEPNVMAFNLIHCCSPLARCSCFIRQPKAKTCGTILCSESKPLMVGMCGARCVERHGLELTSSPRHAHYVHFPASSSATLSGTRWTDGRNFSPVGSRQWRDFK
jgi:hypothetical protein